MATDWGIQQISKLLLLDTDSLKQILDYSATLSDTEAADHLKNLLGYSPAAFEFISSFNQRRKSSKPPASGPINVASSQDDGDRVPRSQARPKKKKAPLNNLPAPRRPEDYGNVTGGYVKQDEEQDYMPSSSTSRPKKEISSGPFSLSTTPAARQTPNLLDPAFHNVHTRSSPARSQQPSRNASPAQPSSSSSRQTSPSSKTRNSKTTTKVSIPGGTAMHGASTTLSDLDSAIRALEMTTNPSLNASNAITTAARKCTCMGTLHPLLTAAPNCLSCGKIICAKEGLGPCTFCGAALLTGSQVQDMIESLRRERANERIAANNAAQAARAGKTTTSGPTPTISAAAALTGPVTGSNGSSSALASAQAHRDKLLNFQNTNAQRTKIVDEASSFELPSQGVTQWGSASERAAQLRAQQRVLREMEFNARPEWEKRRMVVSIDVGKGGKVVRRMEERRFEDEHITDGEAEVYDESDENAVESAQGMSGGGGGAFSKNPLLGKLVKPVWKAGADGGDDGGQRRREGKTPWRRVQDDKDDNEEFILNGGIYGGREQERIFAEEPACG